MFHVLKHWQPQVCKNLDFYLFWSQPEGEAFWQFCFKKSSTIYIHIYNIKHCFLNQFLFLVTHSSTAFKPGNAEKLPDVVFAIECENLVMIIS